MQFPEWTKRDISPPAWIDPRRKPCSRWTLFVGVLLVLTASSLTALNLRPRSLGGPTFNPDPRLDITGYNGAVASDVGECSELGVEILKEEGSAAEAAIVVALCIGSRIPHSSGIGGGGFINIRLPNDTSYIIDAREAAPAAAHKHMFNKSPLLSKWGGLASGVPGELAGLEKLYEMGSSGKFTWKELVDRVADMNEAGFLINKALLEAIPAFDVFANTTAKLSNDCHQVSDWDWLFDASKWGENGWIQRPALAKTLRTVAEYGAKAFYDPNGSIAPHLVNITQLTGGVMTLEDFANYQVQVRQPLETEFMGRKFTTAPVPASGPALIMGLHVMETLLSRKTSDSPLDGVELQRMVETMKWMAASRSNLGDPAFIDNDMIHDMITSEYAQLVIGNISDTHTLKSWRDYHPSYEMNEPHGTSHFSVVDKNGMAVAMTTTVNLYFGNMVCDPVTGVIMNSEMDDFSIPQHGNSFELQPSIYNFVEPGKRPLSSCVPTVGINMDTGLPEIIIGAAGGSHILTAVFEALIRIYGYDLPLLQASSYPRVHHQLIPYQAMIEYGMPKDIVDELRSRGHEVEMRPSSSSMNAIYRDDTGLLHAVSDYYRKSGIAAAY